MLNSFAQLLAPLTVDEYYRDYHGKKPLHIKGAADKLKNVADWETVSNMLSQNGIWTAASLELALQGKKLDAAAYTVPGPDRDNRQNQLVDLAKVKAALASKASLVLNDVTTLSPGIQAVSALLGNELNSSVQANLYCSWQAFQGFGTHFDCHDVWALHIEGRKSWNLYQRHFEAPIPHPKFRGLGADFHKAHKGELVETVHLEPGDILYIPRGYYHDAIATSEATFHIAFGTTPVIGLDLISLLFERALEDVTFRREIDPANLAELGQKLASLASDEISKKHVSAMIAQKRPLLGKLSLPLDATATLYKVRNQNLKLVQQNGRTLLSDGQKGSPVPDGFDQPLAWVLERGEFTETQLGQAFPVLTPELRKQLLQDLSNMRVLAVA